MSAPGVTHLALVGPSASGKSALAFDAARALEDVEIVSMDSMQVYRRLDIGTAKPTIAERAAVRHHLVDIVDPWEEWSVARFQAAARAAVVDIEARGRRALLVGGTGLYVQALLDDLRFPPEDRELRAQLEARTAEPGGLELAFAQLVRADPVAASRIEPGNARRIVRALEVLELTGQPFSSTGPGIGHYGPHALPVRVFGLWLPRAVVDQRISERVQAMRAHGLVDEVRGLVENGAACLSRTARQAIGYKEVLAYLEGGGNGDATAPIDHAFSLIERRTRALARRQRMWFRRDPRITWVGAAENPAVLGGTLLQAWRA